ncbi:MAG: 30S ribosomal protein S12 methylthiotransferase RimO [Candidatus Omnitrophica bacterium]|nr:30S ribosomal protein S12 methylthiotransferase RimO [Candidatus Omnitrophota bacterium]MDD5738145.1 30S ribosomal protein S12 methylthiotransferase RimO [Candidatus Omnitrophota bacterium]
MTIKIALISLGCARNLVDSEVILGTLKKSGYKITDSPSGADIAIVNTCSFIEDAKKESIEAILDLIELKGRKKLKGIIVAGCLPQRYGKELSAELDEVDGFVGVDAANRLPSLIKSLALGRKSDIILRESRYLYNDRSPRLSLTPKHYAYVKISEGCSHRCSFCIIPAIRGPHRSRTAGSVLKESRRLIAKGVKEINIIGQDTSIYGKDIYGRYSLAPLLRKLSRLEGANWIRLLYGHPDHITDELISAISEEANICKYLDIPIQHISGKILKAMGRPATGAHIRDLISRIRKRIPGVALRTSLIVGFPGEGEREFGELKDFVKEARFERLGAFKFSAEEGTAAARMEGQVPEKAKASRWEEIMSIQQRISEKINRSIIGRELDVLIDEPDPSDKGVFLGRSYMDAPEIDGTVFVRGTGIKAGDMVKVRVIDGYEYDLVAEKLQRRQ